MSFHKCVDSFFEMLTFHVTLYFTDVHAITAISHVIMSLTQTLSLLLTDI